MNYLATIHHMSHIPVGSIYRGSGKFDFSADKLPDICKEKLKEVKDNGTAIYTKPGEKVKTSAELKKEGKPISTPNPPKPEKPPKPEDDGKVKP